MNSRKQKSKKGNSNTDSEREGSVTSSVTEDTQLKTSNLDKVDEEENNEQKKIHSQNSSNTSKTTNVRQKNVSKKIIEEENQDVDEINLKRSRKEYNPVEDDDEDYESLDHLHKNPSSNSNSNILYKSQNNFNTSQFQPDLRINADPNFQFKLNPFSEVQNNFGGPSNIPHLYSNYGSQYQPYREYYGPNTSNDLGQFCNQSQQASNYHPSQQKFNQNTSNEQKFNQNTSNEQNFTKLRNVNVMNRDILSETEINCFLNHFITHFTTSIHLENSKLRFDMSVGKFRIRVQKAVFSNYDYIRTSFAILITEACKRLTTDMLETYIKNHCGKLSG
jgi:hypothetical protein